MIAESTSFAIGYIFYYWPHYKDMIEFDCNNLWNNNDHSGYKINDLYVEAKYSSFKEEIAHYPHFNIQDYKEIVEPKVNEFFTTKKVRQIKAKLNVLPTNPIRLKFELAGNDARVKFVIKNVGDERAPLADGYLGFFSDIHRDLGRNYYLDLRVNF